MLKRYEIASSSSMPIITEHPVGRYVLASDYADLQARLSAVEKERDKVAEELHAYKTIIQQTDKAIIHNVSTERDALAQREAALKAGKCLKCNMGPLRESCSYPEACEHPGRELALKLNQSVLNEAALREALVEWIVDIAVFRQHVLAMMETGTRFYRPAIPLLLCQKTLALLGQSDFEHALSPHQPEGGNDA